MSSRTMVAHYVAKTLLNGGDREKVTKEAAAWLKDNGKTRQASYLDKDVAMALADSGYVFVEVVTARPVSEATKQELIAYVTAATNAQKTECEFKTDEKLIGGVLLHTPYGTLDASVRARLAKIVEGASR